MSARGKRREKNSAHGSEASPSPRRFLRLRLAWLSAPCRERQDKGSKSALCRLLCTSASWQSSEPYSRLGGICPVGRGCAQPALFAVMYEQ